MQNDEGKETSVNDEKNPFISNEPMDITPEQPTPRTKRPVSRLSSPVDDIVRWSASEGIDHQRKKGWYIVLSLVVLFIVADAVLLQIFFGLQLWSTAMLAIIIFITIMIISRRPSRTIDYAVSDEGVLVNNKVLPYDNFRAFGVLQDGSLWAIMLIPNKRFGVEVTMYIPEDKGEQVIDILGSVLPMENVKLGPAEKMARKLKL